MMTPLMPSLATGTNVYHPSQGTHGAASATLSRKPEPGETEGHGGNRPPTSDHSAANLDDDGPDGPHPQSPQSSSPPPPPPSPQPLSSPTSPSMLELPSSTSDVLGNCAADSQASASRMSTTHTSSATSVSTASKRKQSALHASQSNTSSSKKQRTTTGAVALNGIKESLDAFNSTLGRSLLLQPERARSDTSPERRSKAMNLLQELESYLDDDRMVAFIDLFKADTAAADAYLAIKHDSLRKKWVEKQLIDQLGFPPMPASDVL